MTNNDVRQELECLIRQYGESYLSVSRLLGRNAAYIQQFIKRGIPEKLDEDDRRRLAQHFEVNEIALGGRRVKYLQNSTAVRVSILLAGITLPGTSLDHIDTNNYALLDHSWLNGIVSSTQRELGIYEVADDAMAQPSKRETMCWSV